MIPTARLINTPLDVSVLLYFTDAWQSAHLATQSADSTFDMLPATEALVHVDELIDHYLGMDDFTCCRVCMGLCIGIAGDDWTGYTGDHLWHFMGWFYALSRVLADGPQSETTTFVWDESLLHLQRNHEWLTLYDEHICTRAAARGEAPSAWYPITVPLWDFATRVADAGTVYVALLEQIRADLTRRGWSPEELLPLLEGQGDQPRAAKEDSALKLAVILRETNVALEPWETVRHMLRQHEAQKQPEE